MPHLLLWAVTAPVNVHRGAVLPLARVVVILVPVLALCFYVFVVRTRRK
ncbi:MAG TPA: hypothetical protein VIJ86_12400 [Acidimicrobiales bacterium]